MSTKNQQTSNESAVYVSKYQAADLIGLSWKTLDLYRDKGLLKQGVHWTRIGSGGRAPVLFHKELLIDWLATQHVPEAHQRAINQFLSQLPSSKAAIVT